MIYYLLVGLSRLVSQMSYPSLEKLAQLSSIVTWRLLFRRKKILLKNTRIFLKSKKRLAAAQSLENEAKKLAKKSLYHSWLLVLEILYNFSKPASVSFKTPNLERLKSLANQEKGFFFLCAHIGNWELLAAEINSKYLPVKILVKPISFLPINTFLLEFRKRVGSDYILRDKDSRVALKLLRALRRRESIGFVLDQKRLFDKKIDFFGLPSWTNSSLERLALKTGTAVLPISTKRISFNVHEIELGESVSKECYEENKLTKVFNRRLEAMIEKKPEQYFWLHDRWKI